jgi:ATP-dependent Lon protease
MTTANRPASGELPLLPLRSMAMLPGLAQPVELGRASSVGAISRARRQPTSSPIANLVIVATQRDPMTEMPELDDIHGMGVLAEVTQALRGVPGRMTAIVRGIERVRLLDLRYETTGPLMTWQRAHETMGDPTLAYAMSGALQDLVKQHESLLPANTKNKGTCADARPDPRRAQSGDRL